jgi:hypothetical protein
LITVGLLVTLLLLGVSNGFNFVGFFVATFVVLTRETVLVVLLAVFGADTVVEDLLLVCPIVDNESLVNSSDVDIFEVLVTFFAVSVTGFVLFVDASPSLVFLVVVVAFFLITEELITIAAGSDAERSLPFVSMNKFRKFFALRALL